MKIPEIKMNTGATIPAIGLGLWQNKDPKEVDIAVRAALETGYRHFDSAQVYGNEELLAEALEKAGAKRQDVFITTKIGVVNFTPMLTRRSFDKSLERLKTDYVDLLLLHFPVTLLRQRAWRDLEEIHGAGKAKAIGVSNYTIRHLEELLASCKVKPAVNQVELHVYLQQPDLLKFCADNDILVEAYSPLAHGYGLDNEALAAVAEKHGKTPAQVMIRWCLDKGTIPLPKSVNAERVKSNIAVFDFKLDEADMAALAALDANHRTCWDPTNVK